MQLLHPFMPFITETIRQALPHEARPLWYPPRPEYKDELQHFAAEEAQMESLGWTLSALSATAAVPRR